ncbi:MAG: AAA family ATPase [Clostridium beijerinckii]|nr:AAA family ATPase [Clostridium beijerinckii]
MKKEIIKRVMQNKSDVEDEFLGTCFFIKSDIAVTARHVVKGKDNVYIKINKDKPISVKCIYGEDKNVDFAILKLDEPYEFNEYYDLNSTEILDNEDWKTFGFPKTKIQGQMINGRVAMANTVEEQLYDIELQMIPDPKLSDYRGISGAPIIIDNTVKAIVKIKPDGRSIGGVKIATCTDFLDSNNIKYKKNYSQWIDRLSNKKISLNDTKFILERSYLTDELIKFTLDDSGLIVGQAGVGKSYIMNKLANELKKLGYTTICIAIDEFVKADKDELEKELYLKPNEDFIDKLYSELKKLDLADKKTIIIFDSFDSARNEDVKEIFLKLIRNIKDRLKGMCNIIVSCRIYDAMLSQKLTDIFLDINGAQKNNNKIKCRHFLIEELSEKEVEEAVSQISNNDYTYTCLSENMKLILKNTFSLWLFENVLDVGVSINEIKIMNSELELLDKFWERQIEGKNKDLIEYVLYDFTEKLIDKKTTIIKKREIFKPDISEGWNDLFSKSIIKYSDDFQNKVIFNHNILFDYAVSKLILIDNRDEIIEFIQSDRSRLIFLRPSFIYFFNSIWHLDNEDFWKTAFKLIESDEMPKITKYIFVNTIITQATDISDLQILIDKWNDNDLNGTEIIKSVLQSIDIFGVIGNELWLEFIDKLKDNIKDEFLGLIVATIDKITTMNIKNNNQLPLLKCNMISRVIYLHIDECSDVTYIRWLRQVQAHGLIPIICKTYATDIANSKIILKEILEKIDNRGDNIDFVRAIAKNIEYIYDTDFEFTEYIFNVIYSVEVTSEETTCLNGSKVMPLLSNKKQDYGLCKNELHHNFIKFIERNAKNGLTLAIKTLNLIIVQKGRSTDQNYNTILEFNGNPIKIIEDQSHWWSNNHIDEDIGEFSKSIFEYLKNIIKNNDTSKLDEFLDIFKREVKVAYLWGRLLITATEKPDIFKEKLFDLCISKDVVMCRDLTYEVAEYIKESSNVFNNEQIMQLEKFINSLNNIIIADNYSEEFIVRTKKKLILCIDKNLLNLKESFELISEIENEDNKYSNEPIFKITIQNYAEERNYDDELKRKNIKLEDSSRISYLLKELDNNNYLLRNKEINESEAKLIFGLSTELYKLIKDIKIEKNLETEILNKISEGIWKVLNLYNMSYIEKEYDMYKDICIHIVDSKFFNKEERNFKGLESGYCSTPKHIAADILPMLIQAKEDKGIIKYLEILFSHPSVSVKCILITNLYRLCSNEEVYMWEKLNEIAKEGNELQIKSLRLPLRNLIKDYNEKVVQVLKSGYDDENLQFINEMIFMILEQHFINKNKWCSSIVEQIATEPWKFKWTGENGITATLFKYIGCDSLKFTQENLAKEMVSFLNEVITNLILRLVELNNLLNSNVDDKEIEDEFRKIYDIFNWILDKLYYESGDLDDKKVDENKRLEEKYYFNIQPIIENIIYFMKKEDAVLILAPTIHNLVKMLNYLLEYDVDNIINFIGVIIQNSCKVGYVNDSLANTEITILMDKLFADYKMNLKNEKVLEDVLVILDCFSEIGDSTAISFLWRLDKIYK